MTSVHVPPLTGIAPTPRSRAWLVLVVSGSVLAVLSAAVGVGPAGLDLLDAEARLLARSSWQPVIDLANVAGSLPFWLTVVGALALLGVVRHWPRLEGLAVAGLAEIASVALKVAVGRPRPLGADTTDFRIGAGFPSGHVTRTSVLIGVVLVVVPLARRHPRATITLGVGAAVLMCIARVASGDHYASDVIGGMLLAAVLLAGWAVGLSRWSPLGDDVLRVPNAAQARG
jgi:membrane-associated phospholipid phosphatase